MRGLIYACWLLKTYKRRPRKNFPVRDQAEYKRGVSLSLCDGCCSAGSFLVKQLFVCLVQSAQSQTDPMFEKAWCVGNYIISHSRHIHTYTPSSQALCIIRWVMFYSTTGEIFRENYVCAAAPCPHHAADPWRGPTDPLFSDFLRFRLRNPPNQVPLVFCCLQSGYKWWKNVWERRWYAAARILF